MGVRLHAVWVVVLSISSCGNGRAIPNEVVDGSTGSINAQCVALCQTARPKLIANFAVPPASINCEDTKWRRAPDCAACLEVFADDYDVATTFQCP